MIRRLLELIGVATERHRGSRWVPPFLRTLARGVTKSLQSQHRRKKMSRVLSGQTANFSDIETFLRMHAVPVRAPLVLISQVQRSGGTLLSQLFDGHPALAAYPDELRFNMNSDTWPELHPGGGNDECFCRLYDPKFPRYPGRGFSKAGHATEHHRFFLIPGLQHALFKHLFETRPPTDSREILNYFFTAYFNAWLNYQGSLQTKSWITAFAPRLAQHEPSVAGFFANYPDGRLIQVLRDPWNWYPSAKHHGKFGPSDKAPSEILSLWCASTEAILRNKMSYGEKVIVLRFEDLVETTEKTMHALARALRIAYEPVLAEPSFNGEPVRANSSFTIRGSGVLAAPLERKEMLTVDERKLVDLQCLSIYETASAVALDVGF